MIPTTALPDPGDAAGNVSNTDDGTIAAEADEQPFTIALDPDVETPADTMYREHLETHWGF